MDAKKRIALYELAARLRKERDDAYKSARECLWFAVVGWGFAVLLAAWLVWG